MVLYPMLCNHVWSELYCVIEVNSCDLNKCWQTFLDPLINLFITYTYKFSFKRFIQQDKRSLK